MPVRSLPLFLALRYLRPRRAFLSIITVISIVGVIFGIWALIVVISVMTGFDRELKRKVVGFDAHLLVTNREIMTDWRSVMTTVKSASTDVVAVSPTVLGPVIAEFNNQRLAPKIRAVDPALEAQVSEIATHVEPGGAWDLDGNKAVVGRELAKALGLQVGDTFIIYSPRNLKEVFDRLEALEKSGATEAARQAELKKVRELALPTEVTVTGIFASGRFAYDSEFIFLPLFLGQELYGLRDEVHSLAVKLQDAYLAERAQKAIAPKLEPSVSVLTWIDLNRTFFDAVRLERTVMFFLLFIIIVVAAFGIMNTLITVTVQKTREIGVLKALGARTGQVTWIFLAQGMVVGLIGNVAGLAIGLGTVRWRNGFARWLAESFGIEIFPSSIYQFSEIPAQIVPGDVALICVSTFVICSLAALIPAWFAARLDPVRALRME